MCYVGDSSDCLLSSTYKELHVKVPAVYIRLPFVAHRKLVQL